MTSPQRNESFDRLGGHLGTFEPSGANIVAGMILSLLLIGAGVAALFFMARDVYRSGGHLPFNAERGNSWLVVGVACLFGAGFIIGGLFLARYVRKLKSRGVELRENGFRYRQGNVIDEIAWSELARVRETILYERAPLLKGPAGLLIPEKASKIYTLTTRGEKEFKFDGNSVAKIKQFGAVLMERAYSAQVPWETVEQH